MLFGQAADPEVDIVNACYGYTDFVVGRPQYAIRAGKIDVGVDARAVQEIEPVGFVRGEDPLLGCPSVDGRGAAQNQRCRYRAHLCQRVDVRSGQGRMRPVGCDEVNQRFRVLQMLHEVDPARVRLDVLVADIIVIRHIVEFAPRLVQRRNPGVAAARQIENCEIERRTQQVVAQRFGDEFVDLVADRPRYATHDGAHRLLRRRSAGDKLERIEEGRNQAELVVGTVWIVDKVEIRVKAVDCFGQHRVAKPVDGVSELGNDRGIDGRVVPERRQEFVDIRLHGAGKLFEHEMLVLHLGSEAGRLE